MNQCANCGSTENLNMNINGVKYCSTKCYREHTYRPKMTDETFQWETTIDHIERDNGKELVILKTVDSFYSEYSGYKVIATVERIFSHKQLNGFATVKEARNWWDAQKEKYNLTSWADSKEA